jgi:N-glycosylase/DNA lyase
MEKLARSVRKLKSGPVSSVIRRRMGEFRSLGRSGPDPVFKELCFCILTANYSAEGGIRMQEGIGDGFLKLEERGLASKLRRLGYRFPNMRARYIADARAMRGELEDALSALPPHELRAWLARNIYGLGYKEASHFLRNIGHTQFAIIDFHIIDILAKNNVIEKPKSKSLSKKRYEEIETTLAGLARASGVSQGELDLYLWYMETGKVLK